MTIEANGAVDPSTGALGAPVLTMPPAAPAPTPGETIPSAPPRAAVDVPEGMTLEQHAKNLGWVPKEQYHGDPSKWRPAEEFIAYGETNRLVKLGEVKRLSAKLSEKEKEIEQIRKEAQEFREFMTGTKKAITDRQTQELLARKRAAYEVGDFDTMMQVDEALGKLKIAEAPPAPPPAPTEHPLVTEWRRENDWYNNDPTLAVEADEVAKGLHARGLRDRELLDNVTKTMKRRYPNEFAIPAPNNDDQGDEPPARAIDPRGSAVSTGGFAVSSAVKPKAKTYANLPEEARRQADVFANKFKLDREDYAKRYFEENA